MIGGIDDTCLNTGSTVDDQYIRNLISESNTNLTYDNTTGLIGFSANPTFSSLTVGTLSGVLKASSGLISGSATTTDLTEGTNLYYTSTRFNTAFSAKSTTDLTEGTNLYYTNTRARTALSVSDANSNLTYNSLTGVFTNTVSPTYTNLIVSGTCTAYNNITTGYVPGSSGGVYLTKSSVYGKPSIQAVTSTFAPEILYINPAGLESVFGSSVVIPNSLILFFKSSGGIYNNASYGSGIYKHTDDHQYYDIQEDKAHIFRTNSYTERMRINSTGVGIGTSTPNTTLEVSGNINQIWTGTPWIGSRYYASGLDSAGTRYTLGMTYDLGNRIVNFDSTQPDGAGGFVWNTGDSQAAKTTKMTLTKAGNLGINTTPSSTIQLNVLGATNSHAMQGYCQSSGYYGGVFYNSSSTTEVDLAGGTYAAVFKNGNVGIGDTAPTNKLVVKADGTFGGGTQQLVIKGSTDANKQLQFGYDTTSNYGYLQATTVGSSYDPLKLNPGGGDTTVGTGLSTTTFATSNTNTSVGGGGSGLYLQNSSNTTNNLFEIFLGGANGAYGEILGCCTNQTSSYGDIAFATRSAAGYAEKMRILSTGNVGIGISNPDCIHHVNNGSDTISWSHYTNSITGSTVNDGSVLGMASSDLYLWNREAGNIFIGQNNATKVLINTSGELNPKSNTVMENNYAIFFKASSGIYNNSTQGSSIIKDSSNDMYYDIQENKSHVFRSNSWVERLRINSTAITMSPDITDMGRSSTYIFVRATNSNLVYNNNASLSAMTSTGDAYTLEFNPSLSTGVLNTDVANVDAYSRFRYGSKIIFAPCYGTLLTSTSGQTQTLSNSSFAKLATFTAGGNSNVCSVDAGNDWITMPNVVYNGQFQYVVSILCRVSTACDVSVYVNPSGHTQVFPLTTTNNTIHYVSYATLAGGDVCTVQVKCSAGSPTFTVDSALFTINRISC